MRKRTAAANGIGEQRYVFVMVGRVGKDQTKERKRGRKRMGARERERGETYYIPKRKSPSSTIRASTILGNGAIYNINH